MKALLVLLCALFVTCVMAQSFDSPVLLDDLPAAFEFAGEDAVIYVDGAVYFVYTTVDSGVMQLVFGKAIPDGAVNHSVIDLSSLPGDLDGRPVISYNNGMMYIVFWKGGRNYTIVSDDHGISWNTEDEQLPSFASTDPNPIIRSSGDFIEIYHTEYRPEGADYHIFTDNYKTTNETDAFFWGIDQVDWPVRVNSDLKIKQAGGGVNGGWPLFQEPVILSGTVQSMSGAYPSEQIFQGGLVENADSLTFQRWSFRNFFATSSYMIGYPGNNDIFYMAVGNGDVMQLWRATLVPRTETIDVYSSYPPPVGEPLFQNVFTTYDTLWAQMPNVSLNYGRMYFFYNPLWIKGTFSNHTKIFSEGDIYLIGDILLSGTPAGSSPLDNTNDRLTLATMKQIIIKYGYKSPIDSLRYHPNCGPDDGGIFIYADLMAPYSGNGNPRTDGVFSFEYQHPHPSTPDFVHNGVLYDKIDLHRRVFPQTAVTPWPILPAGSTHSTRMGLDYPWYNPLWPERQPYKERGTVHLWGSVFQRRQGFLHRSSNDSEYPSHSGGWDIENDICGTPTSVYWSEPIIPGGTSYDFIGINYPGASGSGVGYQKNYHWDSRTTPPSLKPLVFGLGMCISVGFYPYHPEPEMLHNLPLNEEVHSKSYDSLNSYRAAHMNNRVWYGMGRETDEIDTGDDWMLAKIRVIQMRKTLQVWKNTNDTSLKLMMFDGSQGQTTEILYDEPISQAYALNRVPGGFYYASVNSYGNLSIRTISDAGDPVAVSTYSALPSEFANPVLASRKADIVIKPTQEDDLFGIFWIQSEAETEKYLWVANGDMSTISVPEEELIPVAIRVSTFPNPFREQLSIELSSSKSSEVKVKIYNIKGQQVKSLSQEVYSGNNSITWDGKDQSGNSSANGIYFIRVSSPGQNLVYKVLKMR